MALQSSGAISLANLSAEFGGAAPHSLSEYYRGGGLVPNASQNAAVAASGAISLGQFYNAVNRISIPITISANQTNYVLNTAKAAGYVAGISDIVLTINSGVYVSSNSTGVYALDVDTSWSAGDTVTVINNGFVVGRGGAGGLSAGLSGTNTTVPPLVATVGSAGGPALRAQRPIYVNNAGTIGGGGGGGGGGGAYTSTSYDKGSTWYDAIAGGGGGGGRSGATASSGGGIRGTSMAVTVAAAVGASGTTAGGGAGGVGGVNYPAVREGGRGGSGGSWGASGASGANGIGTAYYPANYVGKAGGAAGAATSGNGNITWLATGTRLGTLG